MGDVVDLSDRRTAPHMEGPAFCLKCCHTWCAVVPVGTPEPFECPGCGCFSGRFKYETAPPEGMVWTCSCNDSNQLFYVTDAGEVFCPACGMRQQF